MIKHIVMLRLREYENKTQKLENALLLKKAIEDLRMHIDDILSLEVGLNFNSKPHAFDLVLTAAFRNEDALEAYRMHPEHKKVMVFLNQVTIEKAVADYEV
jgi:ABC-type molybdenum transport system ATPase subunit/photorepair protein PhrA